MEIKAKTLVFEARRFLPYQVIATVHIFKPSWRPSNSSLTNYGFTLYDILQRDHSFKVCDYLSLLGFFSCSVTRIMIDVKIEKAI